jgi:hypothetical protein
MSAPLKVFDEDRFTPYHHDDGSWRIWDWKDNRDICALSGKRDDEVLARRFAKWGNDEKSIK